MRLIGLSGSAGVGKDTIADYLVAEKGFLKFSFSDALYQEVAEAFGLTKEEMDTYKHPDDKETVSFTFAAEHCKDEEFASLLINMGIDAGRANSPREILQLWGTAYRRKQNPNYWVDRAQDTIEGFLASLALFDREGNIKGYKDAPGMVNTSVRFHNERALFDYYDGEIWHVYRPGNYTGEKESYVSELTLPIETGDRIFINNSDIDRLGTAVDIMLRGNYVVASQSLKDKAWVPVFFPMAQKVVADARAKAHDFASMAPSLGDTDDSE